MGGFGRGGEQFERRSSETRAEEIDKLWAWLVEKSHEDPAAAAGVRQLLNQYLNQLGVVNSQGVIDTQAWGELMSAKFLREQNPIKPKGYPEYGEFEHKFKEYSETHDVSELKRHTDNLPQYLYGLGQVIHDRVVYENLFKNDEIAIRGSRVENGKHREASIDVLRMCGFNKPTPWVVIEYETD